LRAFSPPLDGLRGIAIILVLLHHFTIYQPKTGMGAWLAAVPLFGWSGVDLFFVLSGFLITGILIDARGSSRYFTSFYARRTLRIFPLYYLVVFTALVVLPFFPALHDELVGPAPIRSTLPYWLYYTNFQVAEIGFLHGWLDIAWSLAIEEQFYIVWAIVVWLCPPRVLPAVCALVVAVSPIARMMALDRGLDPRAVYVITWFRLDGLAIGALMASMMRLAWVPSMSQWAPWIAGAGAVGLTAVVIGDGDSWWWHRRMQVMGYSLAAVTGASLLVTAVTHPITAAVPRLLSAGWLREFGKYSYSLYLLHLPIMRIVRAYVFDPTTMAIMPVVGQVLFYVVATAPAFAVSWILWRSFEAPILKLKEKFPY
jgi:peptidoglycan/LPS O-acetylase OafA/YrhL